MRSHMTGINDIDVLMTQTCHSDRSVRLRAGSCWWLTAAHLWQLVSAASWQDRPHMSSIARAEALWAFHASGESQCRVMKEKRPALSTGCWCLWHKQHKFRPTALLRRASMASCKRVFEPVLCVCVWTALFSLLTKVLQCSEKVQRRFYQPMCVQTWSRLRVEDKSLLIEASFDSHHFHFQATENQNISTYIDNYSGIAYFCVIRKGFSNCKLWWYLPRLFVL